MQEPSFTDFAHLPRTREESTDDFARENRFPDWSPRATHGAALPCSCSERNSDQDSDARDARHPTATIAIFASFCGILLPRQTTCKSGLTTSRSYWKISRGLSPATSSTSSGAPISRKDCCRLEVSA